MAYRALNGLIGSFAFEQLTVTNAVKTLTSSVYNKADTGNSGNQVTRKIAKFAYISVEGDQIRFTLDGTTPSTTVGHRMNVDDTLTLESEDDIRNFKAFRITTDATINVTYA